MNIYLLTRSEERTRVDEVYGFVIAAHTPTEARRLAMLHHMDEGPQVWHNVLVELIGYTEKWKQPHLIMRDDWGI